MSAPHSPPVKGIALFVHGLWMTGAESLLLRRRLAARGWDLRVFRYSSIAEPMDRVARRCAQMARELAQASSLPVHLVGHSLGGLVIYRMFESGLLEPEPFCGDICRVVFLGTPVRGSAAAQALARHGVTRRLLGRVGERDLVRGLPARWAFAPRLGIVAGTGGRGLGRLVARLAEPHDGAVTVQETQLEGATDRCVLPVSHSLMCFSAVTADKVANFLETSRFEA